MKAAKDYIQGVGFKPDWANMTSDNPNYKAFYTGALNWASMVYEPDQLKEFALIWIKNQNLSIEGFDKLSESKYLTFGKLCWILNEGGFLSEESQKWFDDAFAGLKSMAADIIEIEKNTIKPQIVEKTADWIFIYTYNELDDLYFSKTWDEGQILETLKRYTQTKQSLDLLKERYQVALEEANQARKKYKEYFEKVSDQELDLSKRYYRQILLLIDNFTANKKAQRKPRKVSSSKKIGRMVKNIKYKKEDNQYNLVSIDPSNIIDSVALMVFNTKTRRLAFYVAAEGKKLAIKGTSLQNYDEAKSKSKILRKPDEQLNNLRTANLKRAEVLVNEYLSGKSHIPNGRINSDTILLKKF